MGNDCIVRNFFFLFNQKLSFILVLANFFGKVSVTQTRIMILIMKTLNFLQ